MNLTYLCYGLPKIYECLQELKGFGQTPFYSDEMRIVKEITANNTVFGCKRGSSQPEYFGKPIFFVG